jgi:squalene-hopene/tetraprenyl-beta-curcumene cyclase
VELALLPHRLLAAASLPVVSYAIPALIAVGLARHVRRPSRCPLTRPLRSLFTPSLLDKLTRIQPTSGGFLEAPPLTGFVTMCLAAVGRGDHPVARRGRAFLRRSASAEATWPIDMDLAHWLTSQAASALARADLLDDTARAALRRCILAGQFRKPHPATQSPPGGWGWTDRSGALPDTDDTAAAMLALRALHPSAGAAEVLRSARLGCEWLLRVQNADGGFPTFCPGWGRLDFDASCCDLTAHAIAALAAWSALLPARAKRACQRGLRFLVRTQRSDGSLLALWFGRADTPDQHNPVFGTARVLQHLRDASVSLRLDGARALCARAEAYLISVQHDDGSWGASAGTSPSIEETAAATAALAGQPAADRGAAWLVQRTAGGTIFPAEVIGLYFARLWYAETLYPVIFTLDALARVQRNR